jgi:hypothetical protein
MTRSAAPTTQGIDAGIGRKFQPVPPWVFVSVVWMIIVAVTHPFSTGDTLLFVESVSARLRGYNYQFWDFGHLFWRPFTTVMARLARAVTGSNDPRVISLAPMVALNTVSALGSAIVLLAIMRRLHANRLLAVGVALAFLLTHGVLVYSQNGTSYMSGLLFLTLGLGFATAAADSERRLLVAGAAGVAAALSATLWFNYVITIPAIALAAAVFGRKRDYGAAVIVLVAAAVTGCVAFIGTALAIGLRTPAEFWEWFERSSHGIAGVSGVPRAALGFARSLLFVGEDGGVMRRFLSRDPHAPVTLLEFATTRIWLLGLLWLTGLIALAHLIRTRRHAAVTAVFVAAAIPVIAFAVMWQGGDVPRWFPLYPFLFLIVHAVLTDWQRGRVIRRALAAGLILMAVNNVILLSKIAAENRRDDALMRLSGVARLIADGDLLFCSHYQDDLAQIPNMFPLEPLVAGRSPTLHVLVELAAPQVERWQQVFARRVNRAWEDGNRVWLSKRLLSPVPQPDWEWIEGTDPRITWRAFFDFFSAFDTVDPAGDVDGFVRLDRTPANIAIITQHLPR